MFEGLASFVETNAERLFTRWVEQARARIPDTDEIDLELRDQVPQLLAELVAALRSSAVPTAGLAGDKQRRRHHRLGCDVLVREHRALRDVLFDRLEEAAITLSSAEARLLTDFFSEAIAASAVACGRAREQDERAVTDLVAAERRGDLLAERIRTSEEHWHMLGDALPILVSFVNAEERYGLVNRAYEDWFGVERGEILGRTVREVIGEAAYAVLGPYVKRGLSGERFSFEQYGVPYRSGGVRDVKVSFMPQRDGAGAVMGYVSLVEDVTVSRRMARDRERLLVQRTEVLEAMGDAFFGLDREYRFVVVNRRYEEVFAKSREETIGRVIWDLFPDLPEPHRKALVRCMDERTVVRFLDGGAAFDAWTDVRVYPTGDGGVSAVLRDVSKEQRASTALMKQAELEQQIVGIVSHDLRDPLNVISMGSTMLLRNEQLDAATTKTVARIKNATERANRMVEDLLDFTQARLGGGIHVEPRAMDFGSLVATLVEEVGVANPTRAITLAQEGDARGEWDRHRLVQVVQNLLTNAVKYSAPDSAIEVSTRVRENRIVLVVHNVGAPIPAEKLPLVFEPFQRAVGSTNNTTKSVGLGLYIVKEIVEAHRGSVEVESSEAGGTTFRVSLPRIPPPAPSARRSDPRLT